LIPVPLWIYLLEMSTKMRPDSPLPLSGLCPVRNKLSSRRRESTIPGTPSLYQRVHTDFSRVMGGCRWKAVGAACSEADY